MKIYFANSQGIHAREIRGIEALQNLPPEWYAFANLEMINEGKWGRQIDVAIILDDRIILADIKDWHGKISSDGNTWYQNERIIESSPVKKIADNVRVVASLLKNHVKRMERARDEPSIPWINSCVILTGRCSFDDIDERERSRVFEINEFCRVVTKRQQRYERFGDPGWIDRASPFVAKGSRWRSILSTFFIGKSSNFRAQEKTYAGHRVTSDVVYPHPGGIYVEHECIEINTDRSVGLLRLWDFSKAPVKYASQDYRNDLAGREQSILAYLLDRNPEIERIALRPKVADPDRGIRYWEIFERRKQLRRLVDFLHSDLAEQGRDERLDLVQSLLSHVAELHRMGAAHLDLGKHSVWVELPATVRLSHFLVAHYSENRSLANDRYTFLGNSLTLPEDILGNSSSHFQKDVFLLGRLSHLILLGTEPAGDVGEPPEWNADADAKHEFRDLHAWFAKALDTDTEGRFTHAAAMLEAFNAAISTRGRTAEVIEHLQRYKKWRSLLQVWQEFPLLGEPLKDDDRVLIYISQTGDRKRLVKAWKSTNWVNERTDASRLLDFCERAERLALQHAPGLVPVRDVAYLGDHLVIIMDYVGDQGLDALLADGNVGPEDTLQLLVRLIDAVESLHAFGFGHGDLSPSNIRVHNDEDGLHPVLIDILEFGPERGNPAYEPGFACGSLERDRFAVLKISEEMLDRSNLEPERVAPISTSIRACREDHPRLASFQFLRNALDRALSTQENEDILELVIAWPIVASAGRMLADDGQYYVLVRGEESARIVHVVGADREIRIFLDADQKPQSAHSREVNQARVEGARRHAVAHLKAKVVLQPSAHWNFTHFDPILSLPEVKAALHLEVVIEGDEELNQEDAPASPSVLPIIEEDRGVDDDAPPPTTTEIDVRALWRKLIDVETELYTEAVSDSHSEYSRQHERHFIEYSLSRGTIDFNSNDQIEVQIPHPKRDDWITLGRLDVNLSDSRLLAIDASYAHRREVGILCREGTRLRFSSLFEMDSRNRRNRATTRILDGQSVIQDLIDYFDPLAEPEAKTYGSAPDQVTLHKLYGLNDSQSVSFQHLWANGPLGLLQGPPGTGKTKFIAAFVHYALTGGHMRNVLLASQSHEAVNNAAEEILDLFRKHGDAPSLIRVGQEGVVSDRLMPFHSAHVESLYREKFRARLKENFMMAGRRLGLAESFIEDFFQAAITLRPVLQQVHNLDRALANREVTPEEYQVRSSSLKQTTSRILENLHLPECTFSDTEDAESWFEDTVKGIIETHGITNRESVRRLSRVMRLSNDWLGYVGSYRRNFEEFLVNTRQVVCGTCVGLGRVALGLSDAVFDLVVVDEAARCTPSELAVPLQSAKRVLLVGDHLQLEPFHDGAVVASTAKALGVHPEAVRVSDFQRAFSSTYGQANGQALKVQYRMLEPIGSLVSQAFYEPAVVLEHERKTPILPTDIGPSSWDRPVVWLDTSGFGTAAYQSNTGGRGKSLINNVEADVIVSLLSKLNENQPFQHWLSESVDRDSKPIGVICGYSGQKDLLIRKVAAAGLSPTFRDRIKIDTVDSYQGKQNLIIILSLVRNNDDGRDGTIRQGFMSRVNRINVALSRARDRLVIVGSATRWPTDGPMGSVALRVREFEHEGKARIIDVSNEEWRRL
ncbi:MAG: AAA domain-containing protein [Candidatus Tectimicrobiota bacterium]